VIETDATRALQLPSFGDLPVGQAALRLGKALHARSVWLFGSAARGEAGPDSDIDLLVVVPSSAQPRYKRAQTARQLVSDLRFPKDIIVLTQAEWDEELSVPVSLASTVSVEGKLLYGSHG
jgi:predicted nucleotidyltransferase